MKVFSYVLPNLSQLGYLKSFFPARHGRGEYAFKVLTLLRGPQADIDQEIMAANESKSFNGKIPMF